MTFKLYDLARLIMTVGAIGVLSACNGTGPRADDGQSMTDEPTMNLLADVEASRALGYRVAWQSDLGIPAGHNIRSVTLLDEHIAVIETADRGSLLTMIDEATGRVAWRTQIGRQFEILYPPILEEDNLLIHSNSTLYMIRMQTGEVFDKMDLPYLTKHAGVLTPGQMVYGTPTGRVYAQSLRTGNHIWSYQMSGAISAAPIDLSGLVGVVDNNGGVGVLNFDGIIVWRTIDPPWDANVARPTYAQGTLLVPSTDQKLYAFDRASNEVFWSLLTQSPLVSDPVAIGDRVFQHVPGRGLLALDLLDGSVLWENDGLPADVLKKRSNELLLRSQSGIVVADIESGELLREVALPRVAEVVISDRQDGGPIYLTGQGGRIMKLAPRR